MPRSANDNDSHYRLKAGGLLFRPQAHRHRIGTPSLRGANIQRLFGSQRALKTVEDFTEYEQRPAYFDGAIR